MEMAESMERDIIKYNDEGKLKHLYEIVKKFSKQITAKKKKFESKDSQTLSINIHELPTLNTYISV